MSEEPQDLNRADVKALLARLHTHGWYVDGWQTNVFDADDDLPPVASSEELLAVLDLRLVKVGTRTTTTISIGDSITGLRQLLLRVLANLEDLQQTMEGESDDDVG